MKPSWTRALVVARREYLTTVRRKAFLFTLIAVPLYFGGVMALATRGEVSGRRDSARSMARLGVVDSSGLYAGASRSIVTRVALDPTGDPDRVETFHTDIRPYTDQPGLERALRAGEVSQGLVIPADYLATGHLRRYMRASGLLSSGSPGRPIERWLVQNLLSADVDPLRVERAARPANRMDLYTLDKEGRFVVKDNRREMMDFMVPFMVVMLLVVCIMSGGQYLLQGVSEEKESRILESLLCTLTAEDLLTGKLLGLGATGLTLVAVWMGAGLALGAPAMALAEVHLSPALLGLAVAYFLLGYLFYAGIMTGIGAVTNNMREAQQFAMMLSFASALPIIVLTQILARPDGALAVTLSIFPPTAAAGMMMRLSVPAANVPAWQIAASLVLLAASGWLVLRGASRVFRIGLLMYGKTPSLPEILRWARAGK